MNCTRIVFALLLGATGVFALTLSNGSFELDYDGDGIPDGWDVNIHKGAEGRVTQDLTVSRSGKASLHVAHGNDSAEWVRSSQYPRAVGGHRWRCSGWVKATGRWSVVLYEFANGEYTSLSIADGGAGEWRPFSRIFTAKKETAKFKLSLISNGKGGAWFDDVSLQDLSVPPVARVVPLAEAIEIDGSLDKGWKTVSPFSDFYLLGAKDKAPTARTQVRVALQGEELLLFWDCEEPRMKEQKRGSPAAWGHDTVELFLSSEDVDWYAHLGLTPDGGKLLDMKATQSGTGFYVDWFSKRTTQQKASGKEIPKELQWRAAAKRGGRGWTAEMAIPLTVLGNLRSRWKLQLARSRKVGELEENSSWAAVPGKFFFVPEAFGSCVFMLSEDGLKGAVSAPLPQAPKTVVVVPSPRRLQTDNALLPLPSSLTIGCSGTNQDSPAVRLLRKELEARFSLSVGKADKDELQIKIGKEGAPITIGKDRKGRGLFALKMLEQVVGTELPVTAAGKGDVQLELAADFSPAGQGLLDWQLDESYSLDTRQLPIRLRARSAQGLLYAVQSLRQLIHHHDNGVVVQKAEIEDWPLLEWRGWHLIGPSSAAAAEEGKRVIDVMAAMKYNWIALQIDNRLQYKLDPALAANSSAPTKQQLRDLVAHAESYGMEVIPMTQCWSHFPYFLAKKEFRKYAEIPNPPPDKRRKYWNYCPRHPEVHEKLLFPIIEEILECFPNAKYFHVGLDEITFEAIGVCERCRTAKNGGVLLAEEVKRLHSFLKTKNLRMCMWGDQLLVEHNGDNQYKTALALPEIPRDVIMFDWHYAATEKFPSVSFFKSKGFDVVASGWYEPVNVSNFASVAAAEKVYGYGGTTWWGIDRIKLESRLIHALPLSGEYAWSPRVPVELEKLSFDPAAVFHRFYGEKTESPKHFFPVSLENKLNRTLDDDVRGAGWLGLGAENDFSQFPTGQSFFAGIPFVIPREGKQCVVLAHRDDSQEFPSRADWIPVGGKLAGLAFLQTCERPRKFATHIYDRKKIDPGTIVNYVVHYADGESVVVPQRWRLEMTDWNSKLGASLARTGWRGTCASGAIARAEVFRWTNPRPEVSIVAVDLVSGLDQPRPVLLGLTGWR